VHIREIERADTTTTVQALKTLADVLGATISDLVKHT
jgi:hypothetical protein